MVNYLSDIEKMSQILGKENIDCLINLFEEFNDYKCKFNNCMHINEPQCGVKNALEKNEISKVRYDFYCYVFNNLKNDSRKYIKSNVIKGLDLKTKKL